MRKVLLAAALALTPFAAMAQTTCGGAPLPVVLNQTWTVAQWNGCWDFLLQNASSGGSSSNFNATFPSTGTAIGAYNGGNMVYLGADAFHDLNVNVATPIPAGGNVIGSVTQAGAWNVSLSGVVPLANGASVSGLQGGVFNNVPPTLSNGQQLPLQVDTNGNLKVNIIAGGGGGGGGGTSSAFNSTFPVSGTALGASNGTNMVPLLVDGSGNLKMALVTPIPVGTNVIGSVTQSGMWTVNSASLGSVSGGTAGTQSQLSGAVYNSSAPTLTTGQQASLQLDTNGNLKVNVASGAGGSSFGSTFPATGTAFGVKNGANLVNLTADGSSNLNINCVVGCAGGTTSNASSGVATSSTNGQQVAFNYGFNGTTWDQLQVDGSKFLKVAVAAVLPAGSNVIGGVTQSGTWNVANVSGTISLPTGAATAANQTSVTGTVAAGTAATNSLMAGAIYNSTQPSPTTGQQVAIQTDAHGNLRTNRGSITLVALDVATITTGGTAVTALTAGHRTAGGWLQNPPSATINLCINEISTASGTTTAGSTACIVPGQSYTLAPSTAAVSVISSDSSHPFGGQGWQ